MTQIGKLTARVPRPTPAFLDALARRRAPANQATQLARYLRQLELEQPEPLADMVNRANRTDTLLKSRVARMTPEEQQGSLTAIWAQAQRDAMDAAAARRAAQAGQSERMAGLGRVATHPLTVAGATAAGVGGYMATQDEDEPERLAMPEPEAVVADPEPQPTWWGEMEEDIVPPSMDIGEDPMGDMLMELVDDEVAPYEPEIALNPGDEALVDSVLNSPVPDWYSKRTIREYAMPLGMLSADEAVEMAPGPESQVTETDFNIEDLPGPQQRSLKVLMNSGIPEGRARDIILRGASMSPDEYRMVTGGRR